MTSAATTSYRIQKSTDYPHVFWIELHNDGVLHECAVLKQSRDGNIMFFPINNLDNVDRQRIAGILMDRNAHNFELWDLMAQKTLGNGMNALSYFHQLVRVLTPGGKIMDPKSGQIGMASSGRVAK